MNLTFLGSGSAFTLGHENYHSNILITVDDKNLLYDAGTTIPDALHNVGLSPQDLDAVYISHLHADHAGGLEYIAFKSYFEQFPFGINKIKLFGHHSVLTEGWKHTWSGGLKSITGKTNILSDYFDINIMNTGDSFEFESSIISPIKTIHVVDEVGEVPSFGLMLYYKNKKAFITGDSSFSPEYFNEYYMDSDIIFQEVEFAEYPNSVHTQYKDLKTLHCEIKRKMHLYHYALKDKSFKELNTLVIQDGFAGLVKRGKEFNLEKMR